METEDLGQVVEVHKEMDKVTLVVFHKEIGMDHKERGRKVIEAFACPSRMGSADPFPSAPCLAGPFPSPSAFPSRHTG